jgi:multidrug efflux pump subunit AcrB
MTSRSRKINFSSWAIAHQQLVVFFMLLIMVIGIKSYDMLSRNEDPNFTIKTAVVSAQWPGASLKDTLNFVTDPLEKKLQEIPWLDYVESETRGGRTTIFVNLRDDTPPASVSDIWYQLRKKMQDVAPSLPSGVTGPWVNDEFDDTFGTIYAFTRDGFSARALRDRVDAIRRELMSLPDIGKIQLLGEQEEQVVIAFSPQKMAGMAVTLAQITAALQAQNAVAPSGTVRTDKENIALRVSGAFTSEDSLKAITLHVGDRYIPLTDIATVSREPAEPPTPLFRVNGQPAIGLAVSMAATGNMLRFGKALNDRMDSIGSTLPHGIEMTRVADQSLVVKHAVDEFVRVLIEAIIIVMAVSFVSLGLRAGLVVAAAIPLVLALTFTLMLICGIGLQRISLGALIIALGLLVDDAMITVEAMVGRLEAGDSKIKAAGYAFGTTAFPMLTGTLVMIAGFIPVGFAASSAGEYCFTLFAVVLIALVCSWVVAIVFSPLTGVWILPRQQMRHHQPPSRLRRGYTHWLHLVMRHRGLTLAAALTALALSGAATTLLQGGFFPPSDRPELLVNLTLPGNASQTETARQTERLEKALSGNPDIARFSSYIGSGAIRFYLPMDVALENENIAQLVVVAKDLAARNRLQQQIGDILSRQFTDIVARVYPLELGPPVGWPVKYRVSGPDDEKVRQFAQTLATHIARNPDTREVNVSAGEPERVITLKVNQTAARAAGISSESLAQALNTLWTGVTVTAIRDRNREVEVILRASDEARQDLRSFASLILTTDDGRKIPLNEVATPEWGVDDPLIWRRQRLPVITVQTDIAPGLQAETVSAALLPAVNALRETLPHGYQIEEGGTVAESEKGNRSVFSVLPFSLALTLVLLMLQLKRFSRVLLALFMAPFCLPGIVLLMLPTATPMGFAAILGMIALAGMIVRNAVILISEVDRNTRNGQPRDEAIIAAALHRARPILLTASAAVLGMLPIAGQAFWAPMAFVIIGGLLAATLVTLTLLPVSLSLLMQRENKTVNAPQSC